MHINSHPDIYIRHLCIGGNLSGLLFPHNQLRCPKCGATKSQYISFKAEGHLITEELHQYTRDLLAAGTYTNKQVAEITGLDKNVIKAIDKKRLQELYTTDGGKKLIKPEKQAKFLGIDEFKLHNGRRYATHIIDLETGHVLWIQNGKKKQVVYDFIDHVGMEWMSGVEAVACDMNSDFQEAFEERCDWIQPVFDYFHIVKNFNDKVVSEVRKDEQRRLYEEGNVEAARALKKTRYILMSNRTTLQKKDADAASERVIHKGSPLFKTEDVKRKSGYEEKYDALLQENRLLFTLDLIKEKLSAAYAMTDEVQMMYAISDIIDICKATGNKHLLWFGRLLESHFEGIIAHATYKISAGKIEGINQKIKTLRRHGYGYPDDEYFFLKIMDMSRKPYIRNQASHKILD
ncbi:MAG: ISL3 family transposase [Prevotella sp.]|nr:ISL3 family transposase [Prevotella sp.]